MPTRKKLIEVALPLEKINVASAREKSIRHGHPSTLHLWWARRPLAAARAVIFAQMVDDPSSWPELFPTEEAQETERQRLFRLIERLVLWENTTNDDLLQQARDEIWKSWRRTCADNRDHPRAAELFNPDSLPAFHDPFAGGGALPLEAQRLGLESYASDLNPVAVLINKAMIEIPPKFSGQPPINPDARKGQMRLTHPWKGAAGMAEDVRYYGKWMRDEAEKRIGHLYPRIEVTAAMVRERPDLKPYLGQKLTVIAWLWARTVKSPNPAFRDVDVPLASTFMLSTKPGKEAYVEPVIGSNSYHFTVRMGKLSDAEAAKLGTTAGKRAAFRCLMSNIPITYDHIRTEGQAGRMGARLMAIVAEGERGRVYLAPTPEHEAIARQARPEWRPEVELPHNPRDFKTPNYGMNTFADLFTPRQLVALNTFSELVGEAREQARSAALAAGLRDDGRGLDAGGTGALAYAEAVGVYLAFAISRSADRGSTICSWDNSPKMEALRNTFGRQAIPMVWDFAEGNPLSESSGSWLNNVEWCSKALMSLPSYAFGVATQTTASNQKISISKLISTDPPYCLAPGTLIMTERGYTPIEQIQVGERVLTHEGRFAYVTQTYQRPYQGMIQQIKVAHTSQPLLITDEHPLYVVQTGTCRVGYADYCHISCAWMRQNNGCSARVANQYHLDWVEAAKVKKNDLIFTPVLQPDLALDQIDLHDWLPVDDYLSNGTQLHYQKVTAHSLAHREQTRTAPRRYATDTAIAITPELCRLLGYFVSDGYAQISHDGGAIAFTFHKDETHLHLDVIELMRLCFGVIAGKTVDNAYQHNNSVRLNFYSKPIAQLLRTWCYSPEGFKVLPTWLLQQDETKIEAFLHGYWLGDGSCSPKEAIASSNSALLIGQLRMLLQRVGVMARLHTRQIPTSVVNGKLVKSRGLQYTLHVTGTSLTRLIERLNLFADDPLRESRRSQHGVWSDDGVLLPVRAVDQLEYSGMVYNLETEDHSYVTAAGCVHNCDNIGYADLSDFFYVWLRRTLRPVFPDLFSTMAVPKAEELVATPYRHGGREAAFQFFYDGMAVVMRNLAQQTHTGFPVTIYYAYKQQETNAADGTSSTGWEGFLASVIEAGFAISGTWPMRTELSNRMIGSGTNALASSIVLVCRCRDESAPTVTRRDFVAALKAELPQALKAMQRGNIAPVDLAQAAIGPGMAVFTRYERVIDATGKPLTVREALALINQTLDEVLAEQEGDFDADTRWALAWFEQYGFDMAEYGVAETLSKAKNTSVGGMVEAGLLASKSGKVRLLKPAELPADWNPNDDSRLTVWEMTHHLVRMLEQGEQRAAELLAQLGPQADIARELAYRLYTICERKKRAAEALAYNSLVQSWPEMAQLAEQQTTTHHVQRDLFGGR